MWKIARAWPRVQADGLIRLTTSEYGVSCAAGSNACRSACSRSYGISRDSSSAKSGSNQSGCS